MLKWRQVDNCKQRYDSWERCIRQFFTELKHLSVMDRIGSRLHILLSKFNHTLTKLNSRIFKLGVYQLHTKRNTISAAKLKYFWAFKFLNSIDEKFDWRQIIKSFAISKCRKILFAHFIIALFDKLFYIRLFLLHVRYVF